MDLAVRGLGFRVYNPTIRAWRLGCCKGPMGGCGVLEGVMVLGLRKTSYVTAT